MGRSSGSDPSMNDRDANEAAGCRGCALADRRAFLRDLSLAVAGALAGLGALPGTARAAGIRFIEATETAGLEHRYPIPTTDGVTIDRSEGVMLARVNGKLYALSLACPHQNTALRWEDDAHEFKCPKHHSEFRADGTLIGGRANRSLDRFAVRRDGQDVMVDVDKLYREDEDPGPWSAAQLTVG